MENTQMRDSKSETYINRNSLQGLQNMTFSRNLTQNLKGYDIDLAHSLGISSSFAEVRRPRLIYFSQHRAEPLADCEAQNSDVSSYTFLTYYSTYRRVTF